MKISATSSGGFAGLAQHYEVDTEAGPAGKALELALKAHNYFAAPPATTPIGADLLRWTLSFDDAGQQRSVSFVEDGQAANLPWQELLAQIRAAA
ncbi:protealysin inhibitor emfourin [Rugamonas sp. CCM 8940]|uniref:protealysin inhibitor emfourin n=1 Tax=Rugamonas sp. CCM 8940 TaxID=2765359 RepID=UPI0018F6811C|nr:protealysin inhibitor emfourin [Rugamonas sp. CCM 8940]MBJ7309675.1 hypothetical protein [Rugamonas sp. CCM 8940]